jgi:bilirubin oxidase
MMTVQQMTEGIGGFIIVRDSQEASLTLPRTYGVDDIPLALTSRSYDASNAFAVYNNVNISQYGDYMLTNGTPNAQASLPKQYVRLRILNAEIERGYNLGFSDNRTFYIIANDGGLLNTSVAVTRVKLMVGERIEILVNLSGDEVGSTLDLKAYNSGQAYGFPGGEPITSGLNGSLLNNIDFSVLHINIVATTSNPVTTMPATLANNTYWTAGDATVSRTLYVTGDGSDSAFSFDNTPFSMGTINKTINLNTIEKWTIVNNNVFGHTFHIHDVQFKIVSRSSGPVGDHESGWKDVLYLPLGESVSFVAKFADYADPVHPFMYHCHFANDEDEGMMGQFVVVDGPSGIADRDIMPGTFSLGQNFPNPSNPSTRITYALPTRSHVTLAVFNSLGQKVTELVNAEKEPGVYNVTFNTSGLASGVYLYRMQAGSFVQTKKLVVVK